jgi:glycyl-tRNA synthetase beta chain
MESAKTQSDLTSELLLEIGTEELPAGFILPSLKALKEILGRNLSEARIKYGEIQTFGTPRRLGVVVKNVATKQTSITSEFIGPPYPVGFDSEGNPTKAAEGFAQSQGVPVSKLTCKDTKKGKYLAVKKTVRGHATQTLLKTILPEAITTIPFPKSMRWGRSRLSFARPIHWLLAVFNGRTIPFTIETIKSGRRTYGHRFMNKKSRAVSDFDEYSAALKSAFVIPDFEERMKMVRQTAENAVRSVGGRLLPDEELLNTVANLVEYPAVTVGTFSSDFLQLPDEVLITSMREHQKYFAVIDMQNRLMPYFVAVNNTPVSDMSIVTKGHERVLRARLEDARFFFDEDSKLPPAQLVEKLKGVLFQAKLGTTYEKIGRVKELTAHLSELVSPELKEYASRAAWLSKADLVSQMVGEFPKLQGIMGRIYAERSGEPKDIAQAIEEHYLPTFAGDRLPESPAGVIVSIADKLDTIVGCFGVNLIPTGTSDPYALRRQALGIIHIIFDKGISLSLKALIDKAISLFGDKLSSPPEKIRSDVLIFFRHRLENVMVESGFSKDVIDAVLSASCDDIVSDKARIVALEKLKKEPDFDPIAIAFKRVVNIIKQQKKLIKEGKEALSFRDTVDPGLFQERCESDLYQAFQQTAQAVSNYLQNRAYDEGLRAMVHLKKPIDAFFDGVMVLAEEKELRKNRLALLSKIEELFAQFADFSRLST